MVSVRLGVVALMSGNVFIILLEHNVVHDVWGEGVSSTRCSHSTIEDNVIFDIYSAMLYVMNSEYTLVQRNLVYMTKSMNRDGVSYPGAISHYNEGTAGYMNSYNTFINNIVFNTGKTFLSMCPLTNLLVANNVFINSHDVFHIQINYYEGETGSEFRK